MDIFERKCQPKNGTLSDFYNGKIIFLTGAAGNLGTLILEALLRYFPGIEKVYILLRNKNGQDVKTRKEVIFQKWYFRKLLEQNPKIVEKVYAISGDTSQIQFGMSDEDFAEIVNSVSVVFHVAATLSFFKNIRQISKENCLSIKYLIEMCRKMPNLQAIIYTSTAYSNLYFGVHIPEKVCRLPFRAETYLEALESDKDEDFEKLIRVCQTKCPNNYFFSKCLAENVFNDMASDLPVAIVRPSLIVCTTHKSPLWGYVEEGNVIVDLALAIGKGFARVLYCNPDVVIDMIPGDIVANTHIVAAWSMAFNRRPTPFVINCTGGYVTDINFKVIRETTVAFSTENVPPKSYLSPKLTLLQNKTLYFLYSVYEHYIPACIVDTFMFLRGKKFRILPLYNFYEKVMEKTQFVIFNKFDFQVDNFNNLNEQMEEIDREMFYLDLKGDSCLGILENSLNANPYASWENEKKSKEKMKQEIVMRTRMINVTRIFLMLSAFFLMYMLISLVI